MGRGGKHGTYSGRGQKGQKSRAGRNIKSQMREQLLKIPKRRGFKFGPRAPKLWIIKIGVIDKAFKEGEKVTPQTLLERGLIAKIKGRVPYCKILNGGKISKKLIFEHLAFSEKVRKEIVKTGGTIR